MLRAGWGSFMDAGGRLHGCIREGRGGFADAFLAIPITHMTDASLAIPITPCYPITHVIRMPFTHVIRMPYGCQSVTHVIRTLVLPYRCLPICVVAFLSLWVLWYPNACLWVPCYPKRAWLSLINAFVSLCLPSFLRIPSFPIPTTDLIRMPS